MGTVLEMETFRKQRADPRSRERWESYAFLHHIEGVCPGCGARRCLLVTFHDTGTVAGTEIFSRTLPHYVCDGERIIVQEMPESSGSG